MQFTNTSFSGAGTLSIYPGITANFSNTSGAIGQLLKGGSAIGANVVGSQPIDITITVGGNLTLNPGSVSGTGSRIGSPATHVAGGDPIAAGVEPLR